MANHKPHNEELFEELKNIRVYPKEQIWDAIEKKLVKKNKPVGWLAIKYAASFTAILLLALSFLFNLTTSPENNSAHFDSITYQPLTKKYFRIVNSTNFKEEIQQKNTISTVSQTEIYRTKFDEAVPEVKHLSKIQNEKENSVNNLTDFTPMPQPHFFQALYEITFSDFKPFASLETLKLKDVLIDNSIVNSKESSQLTMANKLSQEDNLTPEVSTHFSRFSITPGVSPVFSGGNSGSNISPQIQEQSQGTTNFSYGLQVAYKVSQKLSLRTGVHQVNTGFQTNNLVMTYQAFSANSYTVASAPYNVGNGVSFMDANTFNQELGANARISTEQASISQELGFIEVPMEAAFQLIDKKVGLSVIGGMSTLFLNQNELRANAPTGSFVIGETNNVNATSFSANFGFGLDYKFTKKLKFNIEPSLRYQMNTFDTSTDFSPYFIGIFSGVKFEF